MRRTKSLFPTEQQKHARESRPFIPKQYAPNDAPHQDLLLAPHQLTDASPVQKLVIGAAALSLAITMSVFGVPSEAHPIQPSAEQTI